MQLIPHELGSEFIKHRFRQAFACGEKGVTDKLAERYPTPFSDSAVHAYA